MKEVEEVILTVSEYGLKNLEYLRHSVARTCTVFFTNYESEQFNERIYL